MAEKRGSASSDDWTKAMLFEGLNLSQLAFAFKQEIPSIQRKLFEGNCKPVGKRNGVDVYVLHEVAPWLVKPAFDVESYIRKMDPRELPKILTKEFWAGQRSKQDYEKNAGLLWPTEKIVEEVGELLKIIKMSTLLVDDAVERQTDLTERQRAIIRSLLRGMLTDIMKRINERIVVPQNGKPQEAVEDEDL